MLQDTAWLLGSSCQVQQPASLPAFLLFFFTLLLGTLHAILPLCLVQRPECSTKKTAAARRQQQQHVQRLPQPTSNQANVANLC